MITNEKEFIHDCEKCIYLGTIEENGNHKYDLYVCKEGLFGNVIIARYGNEGSEYLSANERLFTDNIKYNNVSLIRAYEIAKSRGIL